MLDIAHLRKSYGLQQVLRDVSFRIGSGEKVALVGANGSGKTTLLRIIAGLDLPDGGSRVLDPTATVGFLAQDPDLPGQESLVRAVSRVSAELRRASEEMERLEREVKEGGGWEEDRLECYLKAQDLFERQGGYDCERRAEEILCRLGFKPEDLRKPVGILSGGQKTRAALAQLLVQQPDLLLLDEPTNHLDVTACEWLQDFLRAYRGAALIVSHDRYFLDRVVQKVIVLEAGETETFHGNYSQTADKRAARRAALQKQHEVQQREIERIEEMIARLRRWRQWRQVFSREKQLERLKEEQVARLRTEPRALRLQVGQEARSGDEVVEIRNLSKRYPSSGFRLSVDHLLVLRGQRIGIVGPNGSGKTTLLKIIAGHEPAEGSVRIGASVTPAYFAQDFSHLRPQLTVLEEFVDGTELTAAQARHLLARYLFTGEDVFKPVAALSGGERCRLTLGKVLLSQPNLLLLDEPTNHLDIVSREALEGALHEFRGTLLVASHDRYLLDAVATSVLEVRDGTVRLIEGNYSAYRQVVEQEQAGSAPSEPKRSANPALLRRRQRAIERDERARHRRRLQEVEQQVTTLEAELARLTEAFADPATYRRGEVRQMTLDYQRTQERLRLLEQEWEELMVLLDADGPER